MIILLLPLLLVATVAGGWLYTHWPAIQRRKAEGKEQVQEQRRNAEAAAEADRNRSQQRVRDNPEIALPTVIRGLAPAEMAAEEREVQETLSRAQGDTAAAQDELSSAEDAAPQWYRHPVLRTLVFAAAPAALIVLVANVVFDWMMLKAVSGTGVAIVLACFVPLALLAGACLVSYGSGMHTGGLRRATHRAMTFAGVTMLAVLLMAILYLSPLRTLDAHKAEIDDKRATLSSLSVAHQESPQETTVEMVEAASGELEAAKTAAKSDAHVQRFFGVGLGIAEIIFAEVAIIGFAALPLRRARRRLTQAQVAQTRAEEHLSQIVRAKEQRVEQVATATLDYLQQNDVGNPREVTLQLIAEAGIVRAAIATANLNLIHIEQPTPPETAIDGDRGVPTAAEPSAETTAAGAAFTAVPENSAPMSPQADPLQGPPLGNPPLDVLVDPAPARSGALDHTLDIDDFDISA
jgi:hypothetical protein